MRTSEDTAYETIKELILEGDLPQGEFLSQRMLAEKSGAVVITVRTCLRRLENDGLIENVPKWGVRVPVDTPEKIRDRYYLREVLETAAIKKLREVINEESSKKLFEAADNCDIIKQDSPDAFKSFGKAHMAFHSLIAELSGSELLLKFLNQMNLRSIMLFNAQRGWARGVGYKGSHHEDYLAKTLEGSWKAALQAIKNHMKAGMDAELKYIENN